MEGKWGKINEQGNLIDGSAAEFPPNSIGIGERVSFIGTLVTDELPAELQENPGVMINGTLSYAFANATKNPDGAYTWHIKLFAGTVQTAQTLMERLLIKMGILSSKA